MGNQAINLNYLLSRKDVILKLADKYGLTDVRVFGSIARGEETKESDIDIVVCLDDKKTIKQSYLARLSGFKSDLSKILNRKIDILEEDELRPIVKSRVEKEGIRI